MKEVEVEVKGISALLMHRFNSDEPDSKSVKKTGRKDYKAELENALYKLPDGTIYEPASHLEGSLIKAAGNFQISGRGKKTYKDLIKSAVFVSPDAIPHLKQHYENDARLVVVPATRGRVTRYRPRFDEWGLRFTIQVTDDQLPLEVLKEILDYAGRSVGIGDFRPRFGRFIVTRFEEKR